MKLLPMLLKFKENGKTIDLNNYTGCSYAQESNIRQNSINEKILKWNISNEKQVPLQNIEKSLSFDERSHKTTDYCGFKNKENNNESSIKIQEDLKELYLKNNSNDNITKISHRDYIQNSIKQKAIDNGGNSRVLSKSILEKSKGSILNRSSSFVKRRMHNKNNASPINRKSNAGILFDSQRTNTSKIFKRLNAKMNPCKLTSRSKKQKETNYK